MLLHGSYNLIPRGKANFKNNPPHIPKSLRDKGYKVRWIEDNKQLLKGYWELYKEKIK